MKVRSSYFIAIVFISFGCGGNADVDNNSSENTDFQLGSIENTKGRFYQQHIENEVDWKVWNDSVILKSTAEEKLIIVSLGYASCHWCHEMSEESFNDEEVGKVMNSKFIPVLIDKEHRPDLNKVFMRISVMINGSAGWPLNVIMLPNGRPVFAGGYYEKEEWLNILNYYSELQKNDPKTLQKQADEVLNNLKQLEFEPGEKGGKISNQEVSKTLSNTLEYSDFFLGGLKQNVKFPYPSIWKFCLEQYEHSGNDSAQEIVITTLDKMASGGIYDQLDGGFFRYSTDPRFKVPHFEKMLYDNALLVSLYSDAYVVTGKSSYREVVNNTLQFLEDEMKSESGFYYSSIDADSEGEEGKYYTWTVDEIDSLLGNDAEIFKDLHGFIGIGNWKKKRNVIFEEDDYKMIAKKYGLSRSTLISRIQKCKTKLRRHRTTRVKPSADTNVVTSWNAMLIGAYCQAYKHLGDKEYLERAVDLAGLFEKHLINEDGELLRFGGSNGKTIRAFLPDYAWTINSFLELHQLTLDMKWLMLSKNLLAKADALFGIPGSDFLKYSSESDSLKILDHLDVLDESVPSSNSQLAIAKLKLGTITDNTDVTASAEKMLSAIKSEVKESPIQYANWARLMLMIYKEPVQISIVGKDCEKLRKQFLKYRVSNSVFTGFSGDGELPDYLKYKYEEGETNIFLCKKESCFAKVKTVNQAVKELKSRGYINQ